MSSTAATPETPVGSTPLPAGPHTAAAEAFIEQLRAMRQQIPNFAFAPSKPIPKRLIANATVPDAFVEMVSVNVKNAPQLIVDGADGEQLRNLMFLAAGYTAVANEMDQMAAATHHTVTDARHQAGTIALNVYALAKRLAKKPGNGELIPVVEAMQRALGRTPPHPRKKAAPAPTAPGQPTPTAPASPAPLSMESPQQIPPPTAARPS
jgi:hypothetical protein